MDKKEVTPQMMKFFAPIHNEIKRGAIEANELRKASHHPFGEETHRHQLLPFFKANQGAMEQL